MNEEQEAANAVKFFLRGIRGLAKLEEPLLDLGSIKQAADEAASRVTKLQGEEAQSQESLTKSIVAIRAAELKAQEITVDAKAQAEQILTEARANASEIIAKAQLSGKTAEAESRKGLLAIQASVRQAEERLKIVSAEADAAQTRYESLQSKIDEVIKSVKR